MKPGSRPILTRFILTGLALLVPVLTGLAAGGAGAAEAIAPGARLAATCAGCHGTNGATIGDALPSLAGQPKASLLASLQAFKSGERSSTIMTQLAKGYSDDQLERIAAFFSSQAAPGPTRAAPPGTGS